MAPSAFDLVSARAPVAAAAEPLAGSYWIQIPNSGKYIGRADIETADFAPKRIIVREEPYVWFVQALTPGTTKTKYNLLAGGPGGAPAGRWTGREGVYAFVDRIPGYKKASELVLEAAGGSAKRGFQYTIKQGNDTQSAWYVNSSDEFAPVYAGVKGQPVPFRFIPRPIAIEGGGIAKKSEGGESDVIDVQIV